MVQAAPPCEGVAGGKGEESRPAGGNVAGEVAGHGLEWTDWAPRRVGRESIGHVKIGLSWGVIGEM